ncbi:hypothetical protein EDC01DRAFT_627515 [Geopyxis carbonaria]|nr:hypothetical protein EDC01DRAFT_627515 [Geopyxis carbonaria]
MTEIFRQTASMTRGKKLTPRGKLDMVKCDRCRKSKVKCLFSNGEWPAKCDTCEKKGVDCPEPTRSQKDPKSDKTKIEVISASHGAKMGKLRSNLRIANRRRFTFTIQRTNAIMEENKRLKELVAQLRVQIEDKNSKNGNSPGYDAGIDDGAATKVSAVSIAELEQSTRIVYPYIPPLHEAIMAGMFHPAEESPKPALLSALLSELYPKQFKAFRKLLSNLDEEYCIKIFSEGLPSLRLEDLCLTLQDEHILVLTKSLLDQVQVPPDIITGASLGPDSAQTVRELICDQELPENPPFLSVLKALLFDFEKYVLRQLKGRTLPPISKHFFDDLNFCWVELVSRDKDHRLSPLEVGYRNSLLTTEAYFYEQAKDYAKAHNAYQFLFDSLSCYADYRTIEMLRGIEEVTMKRDLYSCLRMQKYPGFTGTIPRSHVPGIYDPVYDKGSDTSSECRFKVTAETVPVFEIEPPNWLRNRTSWQASFTSIFLPSHADSGDVRSDAPSDYSFPTLRSVKTWNEIGPTPGNS